MLVVDVGRTMSGFLANNAESLKKTEKEVYALLEDGVFAHDGAGGKIRMGEARVNSVQERQSGLHVGRRL